MMEEKVSVQIVPNALESILNLLNVMEYPTPESQKLMIELLSGEAKVFRYPQKNDAFFYVGVLLQHKESKKIMQLLLQVGETVTILDVVIDAQVNDLTDYIDVNLTCTLEANFSFSADFMAKYYDLQMEQQHVDVLEQLEDWSNYISFLIKKMDKTFTIQKIDKINNNESHVFLYPENALHGLDVGADENLVTDYAFYNQTVAKVSSWDATQFKLVVHSNDSLLLNSGQEVKIQNVENYTRLLENYGEVSSILAQEKVEPTLNHPLLNPLYPITSGGRFFGYTTKEENVSLAIEQLVSLAETQTEKLVVIAERPERERFLLEEYSSILPINSLNEKQNLISSVKEPIKEKSSIKYKELENTVSKEEVAVQNRAIQTNEEKLTVRMGRIEVFEETQRFLSSESTKNTNKMNAFLRLITSYEEEQEQLAFRNDQLIQSKAELEASIKEQQQILDEIETKQNEEKVFFESLEEDWLIFNKESTIYTDQITINKNIVKSEQIIEECMGKLKLIRDEIAIGDGLSDAMQTEFEAFKENQDVNKVDQLIIKMKEAAYFLDTHVDLQFANSYAELTHIYMEKFSEIEALEERLKPSERLIEEELKLNQIYVSKVVSSPYNFDRHYTEEKMANVISVIEKKPLAIGINFKAKQKWKESFITVVEDLNQMLFAMNAEKSVLENKLMAQLDYAEQLLQYFENDIRQLNIILEDQQVSLKNSEAEYQDIIDAANYDIQTMEKQIEEGMQVTEGRSKNYESLTDLENKRKSFKADLLTKYESLEMQGNEIEKATKFLHNLEEKHEAKVEEVLQDKREMNIQIDVLQHDIVNSKAAIDKLKQENQLINEQYEEIVKQIHHVQLEMDRISAQTLLITDDVAMKDAMAAQNKKMLVVMKKWQDQLENTQSNTTWEKLVDQKSRLRFHASFDLVQHQLEQTVIFEDQQFSWIDIVNRLKQQSNAFFVTTDISQRQLSDLQAFEDYLEGQGKNVLQRRKTMELLKRNPFTKYAQAFERVETPYLVPENEKISFM